MKLFESIQIKGGAPQNLDYHNQRMNRSRKELFGDSKELLLEDCIEVPKEFANGIVKCRVEYSRQIEKIGFEKYEAKQHDAFFLVDSNIGYDHKYIDRNKLIQLKSDFSASSEIIIVKNGFITDTSYSNLIFKEKKGDWYTPKTYLLKGIQRSYLLNMGIIKERHIQRKQLKKFSSFMLVNAMRNFDDQNALPIEKILNLQ
jgi:4-amino-4-deoxychorismate lyase